MNPILQVHSNVDEDDSIDLARYLSFASGNRWLIAGVALFVTLLGLIYVLIATPIYKTNILIKVEDNAGRRDKILDDLSKSTEGKQDIKTAVESEMEILRSRSVVSRAVDSGRFYIDAQPKYFPGIGAWIARGSKQLSQPGLFGFGGFVWGAEQVNVSVFNVPEALEGLAFVLTAEGGSRFRLRQAAQGIDISGRVNDVVRANTASGEVELRIDQLAALPGARFSLTRAARLETIEQLQGALKISEKGKQSGVVEVALEGKDPKRTTHVLNEIGREYIRQNVDHKSEETQKTLAFLNTQLPELKRELERSEATYNDMRKSRGTVDLGGEARTILEQSVQNQTKMVELKQMKEALLMRFKEAHPYVEAINQQMRGLSRELASVEAKLERLPDVEQNVLRLSRDVKINTELYTSLLSTAQQLRVATESKIGSVRLLDTAVMPVKPIKPNRPMVVALAAAIGLVLGLISAFTRKTVYRRIDAPQEIEQLLGLPVCATIPHSASQKRLGAQLHRTTNKVSVLSLDVPSDSTVESLRRFRTALQFEMLGAKNNIIMITGPTPGVGKSFVSANLAAVLASIGKRVLLIDADLRTGHLHRYFGLQREDGLSEAIATKGQLDHQSIHKNVVENVDFVSTGRLPRKPAELLAHGNFARFVELHAARYDFILIDTAPVLAVSDALVVASHAGVIFNVVRGGLSTVGEVEEAVKRLNQAGYTVTGVVFNDMKSRQARYGYGAQYEKYRTLEVETS
jgi:tyrosine-protein kinase Etk/Wzc